ncbi:MAG TPA: PhoH family protein, partial [Ornithinibacter sp.]|nr:PhoH family protein [Ornithinibacter sp.]
MTDAHTDRPGPAEAAPGQTHPHVRQHTVVVPPEVAMVTLLGPRDEMLRTMERQFPHVQIHVRGNEFSVSGPSADVALVERLIDELLDVIDAGQPLNRDAVERSIQMLRAQTV